MTCAEIWQQNLANDVQGALLPFQPHSLPKTWMIWPQPS